MSTADKSTTKTLGAALIAESKHRLLDESLPRIKKCLELCDDTEIWHRANDQVVSIGNLVLHLCGNVRQWIICGLGGQPDRRNRDAEFSEQGPVPKAELERRLDETMAKAGRAIDGVDPASLLETRTVQGNEETGISILVHVVEHFSYHTGQISYITKLRKHVDLGYYAGQDLNAKNA